MQNEPQNGLQARVNTYELTQKAKLVELGRSTKPYKDILAYLKNEIETSKKMTNFRYEILCFKNDGAYSLHRAIEEIYGVSQAQGEKQMSGGIGNIETVDVILADGTRIKVPYGTIQLPDAGEGAAIEISYDTTNNKLHVKGSCQFMFASMIDDIITRTKELLNTSSIYKDQAIELDSKYNPAILNLSNIDKEFMVLSERTEYELRPLMSRIERPDECRKAGIPLKTGILLEGPYGTGKTLLAFKIAQKAIKNGWAFVYLKDPTLLARTLKLSKTLDNNGNGLVLFLEDVDQVTRGNRDAAMQDILNTLDGGDTKQMNVIVLFTTNHIEMIDPTFLRGKRIGSIVSMGHLDAETAKLFLEHTFKDGYELEKADWSVVCEKIEHAQIVPAFMAEIVEKVKANLIFDNSNIVTTKAVDFSLQSYLRQVNLARTKNLTETASEVLARGLVGVLKAESQEKQITEIHSAVVEEA